MRDRKVQIRYRDTLGGSWTVTGLWLSQVQVLASRHLETEWRKDGLSPWRPSSQARVT
jgi:hypothetical protein